MEQLSIRQATTVIIGGYIHIIIPDGTSSTGYRSYKILVSDLLAETEKSVNKNIANGYAGLNEFGLIPNSLLPYAMDQLLGYANLAAFPVTGQANKIYVALDTLIKYAWLTNQYVQIDVGAVLSVNTKTGHVSITTADIPASTDKNYLTDALLAKLISLTGIDATAFHSDVNSEISGLTDIGTINDASVLLAEKTSTFNKVKVTFIALYNWIKGKTDLIYAGINHNHSTLYEPKRVAGQNYVSDTEKTVLSQTSGTNTGDEVVDQDTIIGSGTNGDPLRVNTSNLGLNLDAINLKTDKPSHFGRLYNYPVIASGKLPAVGWYIPTKAQWESFLDSIDTFVLTNWPLAGKYLKESGIKHWTSDNGTNNYSFGGRGAGIRTTVFENLKSANYIWSSTSNDTATAWSLYLNNAGVEADVVATNKVNGASVRLFKSSTALSNGEIGTYVQNDGTVLPTICIQGIEMLAVDLIETKYNDNTGIPNVAYQTDWNNDTAGAYCDYDNNIDNSIYRTLKQYVDENSYDTNAIHKTTGAEISTLTEKTAIVDNDIFLAENSENAFSKIKVKWSSSKAVLKTYFDGLYATIANVLGRQILHGVHTLPAAPSFTGNIYTLPGSTPYSVYIGGVKYDINTAKTLDFDAISEYSAASFANKQGQWFIWMYISGGVPVLNASKTAWDILDETVISIDTAYANDNGAAVIEWIIAKEKHGSKRNLLMHKMEHDTDGARWVSGLNTLTVGSGAINNSTNTFSLAGGVIRDEDLYHTISNPQTQCRIGRKNGSTNAMIFEAASTAYAKLNAGTPQYDNNGTPTNLSEGQYGVYWQFETNRIVTPTVHIMGQAQYANVAAAQAAPMPTLYGLSVAEWKLINRIIIRNVGGNLNWIQTDPMYQTTAGPAVGGGGISTISAGNVNLTSTTNIVSTNAQAGFAELDLKLLGYTSTATAAGTTTLDVNSNYLQRFTGTTTHTLQLPNTTTLTNGRTFRIENDSTGDVTINSAGASLVAKLGAKRRIILICIDNTSDAVASWEILDNFESEKVACSDVTTAITAAAGKAIWSCSYNFRLLGVYASVNTAPTGSAITIDFNNGANSFLSTKLTIDATEKTSLTAAFAAVINATYQNYTAGDELSIDFDAVGSSTGGKGVIFQYDYIRR